MPKHALLLGATGLVGHHCLQELLSRPEYGEITAWVRRPLGISDPKLRVVEVDFAKPPMTGPRIDHVYSCLGTTIRKAGSQAAFREVDYAIPMRCLDAATSRGATSLALVSAVGADASSRVFYSRVKGELEDAVQRLPFRSREIFRPSFLVGDRGESRPGERLGIAAFRALTPVLAGPLSKYRAVDAQAVARAMVKAILEEREGTRVHHWDEINLSF
jgi:uncharacterized protein YbjT (DUF2867 family)